jgi:hypothetical protein
VVAADEGGEGKANGDSSGDSQGGHRQNSIDGGIDGDRQGNEPDGNSRPIRRQRLGGGGKPGVLMSDVVCFLNGFGLLHQENPYWVYVRSPYHFQ